MTETASPPPAITPEKVMTTYIALRDKRAALKKRFEELDEQLKADMAKMDSWLLKKLNDVGTDSIKNAAGTAYISETVRAGCADWTLFWKWCADNERVDMLEKRVASKAIQDYMEEHNNELPPGITITVYRDVIVRRAST